VSGALAVALHDVEPRSFGRCREIRHWLHARGVTRVTLLVIPASDLHPLGPRAPALVSWLRASTAGGDVVAQHGLAHRRAVRPPWPRSVLADLQGGAAAEFPGLSPEDTACRVNAGLRVLRAIELDPRGFVAPGYAYTRALRSVLEDSFDWFADVRAIRLSAHRSLRSPALCLGTSTALKRRISPALVRAAALRSREVLRIDIHPADFDLPGHVATLEWLLERAEQRTAVTYDQLVV
jgi:predicted deacetylase